MGNAGSLVGLLSYPLVVERALVLPGQAQLWTVGYVIFLLAAAAAAWPAIRHRTSEHDQPVARATDLSWRTQIKWVGLAFIPSSLLLGSTSFITAEVGSIPLLWVLPLAVYLVTFIVAFARGDGPSAAVGSVILKAAAIALFVTWALRMQEPLWAVVALHLVLLLGAGLLVHGRLYEERPPAGDLTRFYLLISLGGVLGGLFNALVAPLLFVVPVEYPLVLVLALLVRKMSMDDRPLLVRYALSLAAPMAMGGLGVITGSLEAPPAAAMAITLTVPALLLMAIRYPPAFALAFALLLVLRPPVSATGLYLARTFFGLHRVTEVDGVHTLFNGLTVHGIQLPGEGSRDPTAYYHRTGPLGDVFRLFREPSRGPGDWSGGR